MIRVRDEKEEAEGEMVLVEAGSRRSCVILGMPAPMTTMSKKVVNRLLKSEPKTCAAAK